MAGVCEYLPFFLSLGTRRKLLRHYASSRMPGPRALITSGSRGQARKDLPAYRDDKDLDDRIKEFILDEGMDWPKLARILLKSACLAVCASSVVLQ